MIVAQLFVACLVALACGSLVKRQDASPPSLQERWYNCRDNWCVVNSVRLEVMLILLSATMLSICLVHLVCISYYYIPLFLTLMQVSALNQLSPRTTRTVFSALAQTTTTSGITTAERTTWTAQVLPADSARSHCLASNPTSLK